MEWSELAGWGLFILKVADDIMEKSPPSTPVIGRYKGIYSIVKKAVLRVITRKKINAGV